MLIDIDIVMVDFYVFQIQGFFSVLVDNFYVEFFFFCYIRENFNLEDCVIVLFDVGGVKCVILIVDYFNIVFVFIYKECFWLNVVGCMVFVGNVEDKVVIFVDDMVDICGILVKVVVVFKENGVKLVLVFVIYGILFGNVIEILNGSVFIVLVVINIVLFGDKVQRCFKFCVIDISLIVVEVICCIYNGNCYIFLFFVFCIDLCR